MIKRRRFVSLIAALIMLNGCDSVSTEDDPSSVADLCQNIFDLCISPILQGPIGPGVVSGLGPVSCAASACHTASGSGGGFVLIQSPGSASDLAFNFNSAQAFVNAANVSQSRLLAEPLVGDGGVASIGSHGGGDVFANSSVACYQEIFNWASTPNGTCPTNCSVLTGTGPTPADLAACTP